MKQHVTKIIAIVFLAALLASCHKDYNPTTEAPGFLPDYSILKKVPSADGTEIYTYKSPSFKRSDYHAVIVMPVTLYQSATKKGVTEKQITAARTDIQDHITQIVNKQMPTAKKPGPGVARLNVAITGAMVENESLKIRNLIPISAAITIASRATGVNKKNAVLVVELKFTDSVSGKLLRETVSVINGEKFRMKSNTATEFTALANQWVKQALQYSSKQVN
tara:strand:- start:10212 stop:10874 length:663 start_codon:yes stop_codon:yes gene_type:complete